MEMKGQKGFGLLEILITLVVLGVGIVGLVAMSKSALTVSQDGRRYETAMRLAESKLDEFRNFNSVVNATAPLTAYNQIASANSTVTLSGEAYSVGWTVTNQYLNGSTWQNVAPAGYRLSYPGRKAITVNVGWTDSEGQALYIATGWQCFAHRVFELLPTRWRFEYGEAGPQGQLYPRRGA